MTETRGAQPTPVGCAEDAGLGAVVACPVCRGSGLDVNPGQRPECSACGWTGQWTGGVPDFVLESGLGNEHRAEMEAQEHAVEEYYENEEKLSCHWDRISADRLPELLGVPAGTILDLGCGTGVAGAAFHRAGFQVIGADLVTSCLLAAKKRLDGVVRCDAAHLPFRDGAFDGIVSRGALHHMADPDAVLTEAARVLRPSGAALFLDPRAFAWLEPFKRWVRRGDVSFTEDHRAYTVREYEALIARRFEVERVTTHYPLAILAAVGLDLFALPRALPKRRTAEGLLRLDEALTRTPLRLGGHLIAVRCRRR